MERKIAEGRPSIVTPGAKSIAMISKNAFISRENKPTVKTVSGSVTRIKKGRIKALIRLIIIANNTPANNPSILKPGSSDDATRAETSSTINMADVRNII